MKDYTTITTPEAAFKKLKRKFIMPDVSAWPKEDQKYAIADFLLIAIFKACNMKDGKVWKPNYSNRSEIKWEIWLEINATKDKPSGVGFSGAYYDRWNAHSIASSRLCCREKEIAIHIFENFKQLFIDRHLMINTKTKK